MALLSSGDGHVVVDSKAVSSVCSRSESFSFSYGYMEHNCMMMMVMEKTHVFPRSYQLCRKRPPTQRMKRSLLRVKRVIMWFRLRSARKLRFAWSGLIWLVLSRLRFALLCCGKRYIALVS